MTITYSTADEFHDGILACVSRGLTFAADFDTLTITLNGGY